MNADPSSHQIGFQVGDYRFEVIRTQFPAYLAIDGQQKPAHATTEIWIGKWYFVPSTSELGGIGVTVFLMLTALLLAALIRRRKSNPTH
jgi:uncharacterized protein (TIGR03382 family)